MDRPTQDHHLVITNDGTADPDSVTASIREADPGRCNSCGRLTGMPTTPCHDCPDAAPL